MALYAIKTPKGTLIERTASPFKEDCWNFLDGDSAFERAVDSRAKSGDETFWFGDTKSLGRKLGYKCVRVYLVTERN